MARTLAAVSAALAVQILAPISAGALSIDGPVLLDFRVDPEENVFPMVPAGERIDKMIDLA